MSLEGKHILLGITSSVAAYKSATLVRELRRRGALVQVVMTPAAAKFVTPLTFQSLSGQKVEMQLFGHADNDGMRHIELARWADLFVIVPASANTIAKLAQGIADDLLSTIYLACDVNVAIAPAMNRVMWEHQATQENIKILIQHGVQIWGPDTGEQACGEEGEGRMLEALNLADNIDAIFGEQILDGYKIVVTAGPTQESIDDVRYLTNFSSGKMGFSLAQAACELGAETILITGPVTLPTPRSVTRFNVKTATQMYSTVMEQLDNTQIFISCAAVADYRPADTVSGKIKKEKETQRLELIRNPDILSAITKGTQPPFCIGFAAETHALEANAKAKLLHKNLDIIVANQVGTHATYGFNHDMNEVTVYWRTGSRDFSPESKTSLAKKLMSLFIELYHQHGKGQYIKGLRKKNTA